MPKKAEKVIVKEVKEESSESEYVESSEEEEVDDSDVEVDEKKATKESKPKKVKDTFNDMHKHIMDKFEEKKNLKKELDDKYKELDAIQKKINAIERDIVSEFKDLEKRKNEEEAVAIKTKPKRTSTVRAGILEEKPVPETLTKFLGLNKDVKMTRPKIVSAFHAKLSELGLKEKQWAVLDKATIKILGLPEKKMADFWKEMGVEDKEDANKIEFGEFQKFIAYFYKKDVKEVIKV